MWTKFQCVAVVSGLAIGLFEPTIIAVAQFQTPPPPPVLGTSAMLYRVVVDSADLNILQQVRQVSGDAFVESFTDGRDRIQAGAFESEGGARRRVDELARIGVRAVAYDMQGQAVYQAIAPVQQTNMPESTPIFPPPPAMARPTPTPAQAVTKMPRGFYAIVPINRDQVGMTFEAIRELGIPEEFIMVGEQLRGWHIAVGVYPDRAGAETLSQYLRRKGGFDARTYFAP